ncbi:hypothetical protein H2248_004428 [Termitomyces sp. 'cryptogamus']|nr:hypothetical protein H2248_004428 [Termitomyces sp. 'cryptogamus']
MHKANASHSAVLRLDGIIYVCRLENSEENLCCPICNMHFNQVDREGWNHHIRTHHPAQKSGNPSGSKPIEDENLKNPSISTQGDTKKTAPRSRFRPARPAKAPKSRMKQNWFIEIPVRAVSLNEDRSSKMDEKGDYDTWSP